LAPFTDPQDKVLELLLPVPKVAVVVNNCPQCALGSLTKQSLDQCKVIYLEELESRNLISHFDMHSHAGSTLHYRVTLTFDLLALGAVHAEVLP